MTRDRDDDRTQAETAAFAVGQLIGAASCYDGIAPERIQALSVSAANAIAGIAESEEDLEAAKVCFADGIEYGTAAAQQGQMPAEEVEATFAELEERLAS